MHVESFRREHSRRTNGAQRTLAVMSGRRDCDRNRITTRLRPELQTAESLGLQRGNIRYATEGSEIQILSPDQPAARASCLVFRVQSASISRQCRSLQSNDACCCERSELLRTKGAFGDDANEFARLQSPVMLSCVMVFHVIGSVSTTRRGSWWS